MSITVNLNYTDAAGKARAFAEEMVSNGTVKAIQEDPAICVMNTFSPWSEV